MGKTLLALFVIFSHICPTVGALVVSNDIKMNKKRDNDTAKCANSADSAPEYAAFIELVRLLIVALCTISLSWFSVVMALW